MEKLLKIFVSLGVRMMIILTIIGGVAWFVYRNPVENVEPFVDIVMATSSVLFGFLTLSMTRFLEELRKQKQEISNVAAELLGVLDKVRDDKKLAEKTIHFSTKYYHWGFEGFGCSGEAEFVILMAYDYLLKSFREGVHICGLLVFLWSAPSLGLLILSIILAVFSKIIVIDPNLVVTAGLLAITVTIAIMIPGWLDLNVKLERHRDSLFNIRHTILGDLHQEHSGVGYMEESY